MKPLWAKPCALMLALFLLAGAAGAEDAQKDCLENLFSYNICLNPEIAQQEGFDKANLIFEEPAQASAYREALLKYADDQAADMTEGPIQFHAGRALAVNDLAALEWAVTNVGNEPRYIVTDYMLLDGRDDCAYTGSSPVSALLRPGESREGASAVMALGCAGEEAVLSMSCTEYRLKAGAPSKEDEIREEDLELIAVRQFEIRIPRHFAPVYALEAPVEIPWRGGTLQITSAQVSLSGGVFTLTQIYDTEADALAHNPFSSDEWDFEVWSDDDERADQWIAIGGGEGMDEPIRLKDGRYAYIMTKTAEMLNWLPDGWKLVLSEPDENGNYLPCENGVIPLELKECG